VQARAFIFTVGNVKQCSEAQQIYIIVIWQWFPYWRSK